MLLRLLACSLAAARKSRAASIAVSAASVLSQRCQGFWNVSPFAKKSYVQIQSQNCVH